MSVVVFEACTNRTNSDSLVETNLVNVVGLSQLFGVWLEGGFWGVMELSFAVKQANLNLGI